MMHILAAGPTGLDDWLQAIILILVIAGSALGAISKKLIEFFSPQNGGRDDFKRKHADGGPPKIPPTPQARPVAGHPHVPSDSPTWRHTREEHHGPQERRRTQVQAVPPPAKPIPRRERQARPSRPPPVRRAYRHQEKTRRAGEEVQTEGLVVKSGDVTVAEISLGHLSSAIEEAGSQGRAAQKTRRRQRDMVSRGGITLREQPEAAPTAAALAVFDLKKPATLRRAIVLSEILGPPVAVRDPEEHI